jgi:hypothetical protein
MAFITEDDYTTLITPEDLEVIQQATEQNRLNAEIAAIEYFSGYIRSRYNTDALFAKLADERDNNLLIFIIDQVLYTLHSNLPGNLIPEIRMQRKEELDKWLLQIQNGKFQPNWPTWDSDEETDQGNPIKFGSNTKMGSSW